MRRFEVDLDRNAIPFALDEAINGLKEHPNDWWYELVSEGKVVAVLVHPDNPLLEEL